MGDLHDIGTSALVHSAHIFIVIKSLRHIPEGHSDKRAQDVGVVMQGDCERKGYQKSNLESPRTLDTLPICSWRRRRRRHRGMSIFHHSLREQKFS